MAANSREDAARRHLPVLVAYCEGLLALAPKIFAAGLRHPTDKHFPFFATCFASKQIFHASSVLTLLRAGQHRDAAVIARAMLEAEAIQVWVARDPEARSVLWRLYALVMDYNLLIQKEAAGEEVEASVAAKIRERALHEAGVFLKKAAKDAIKAGRKLPENPFLPKWHLSGGVDATREMFYEAGMAAQYATYSNISDWFHSNPRGIGAALRREKGIYRLHLDSVGFAADAAAAAAQALEYSLSMLLQVFNLDIPELATLKSDTGAKLSSL